MNTTNTIQLALEKLHQLVKANGGGGGGSVDLSTIEAELATLNATQNYISLLTENIDQSTSDLITVKLNFNDWETQAVGNRKVIAYTTSTPSGAEEIDTISYYRGATLEATVQFTYTLASDGINNIITQVERTA